MNSKSMLILAGCTVFTASALADATADFKKFLKAEMPRVKKAFENKDVSYFDKMSTPDFKEVEGKTSVSKAQSLAMMKQQSATMKSMKVDFTLVSAKASGNTGTCTTHGHFTAVTMPDGKGKSHTMVMDMTEKETWVRSGKGWKIKVLEQVGGKMTMDGKPMSMPGG